MSLELVDGHPPAFRVGVEGVNTCFCFSSTWKNKSACKPLFLGAAPWPWQARKGVRPLLGAGVLSRLVEPDTPCVQRAARGVVRASSAGVRASGG